jgi:hypothetical protein
MAAGVHRPLKVITFNANGIRRQRYELSKQLQDLHIDEALLSESPELAVGKILARKKLGYAKKTSYVT